MRSGRPVGTDRPGAEARARPEPELEPGIEPGTGAAGDGSWPSTGEVVTGSAGEATVDRVQPDTVAEIRATARPAPETEARAASSILSRHPDEFAPTPGNA